MGMLTEHFSATELGVNFVNGLAALSTEEQRLRKNALTLCQDILEPLRAKVGPVNVHDGYRDTFHNAVTGGVSNSFHLYNLDEAAADVSAEAFPILKMFDWIRLESKLPFDKVILEYDKVSNVPMTVHLQYYTERKEKNRREAYVGFTHGQGGYTQVEVI